MKYLLITSFESHHPSKLETTELDVPLTRRASTVAEMEITSTKGSEETFGTTQISSHLAQGVFHYPMHSRF